MRRYQIFVTPKNRIVAAAIFGKVGFNLGGFLGACVLSFTVLLALTIGIAGAYAVVVTILHAFASRSEARRSKGPVLVSKARAAHAGGD